MRIVLLLLCVCAALSGVSNVLAATPKTDARAPLAGKLDHRLIPATRALDEGVASEAQLLPGVQAQLGPLIADSGDHAVLALELDVPTVNAQSVAAIAASGARVNSSNPRWNTVSVSATLDQAVTLANLPVVRAVKLAPRATHRAQQGQGIAYNQADATLRADVARNTTGLSGIGQKIGVLSDSFNDGSLVGPGSRTTVAGGTLVSGTTPQQTGDLPPQVLVVDFGPGGGTDEGEGMLELIHDIAPNAALAFASGNTDVPSYADNITKLRATGCTITCDDLFYYNEPCFQDGPVAQAINSGFDAGVPHFTAAGNEANNGVLATYAPVNPANSTDNSLNTPDGQDFHNWAVTAGTTPGFLPIDVPYGQDVTVMLQWNQPYASYNLGPGSSVDLDLLLYDAPNAVTGNLIAAGGESQFVNGQPSGDPLEVLQYYNFTGATQRVYLAVNHYAGSRVNTVFRLVFLNRWNGLTFPSGGVDGMSIFGHSGCAKAISVGAIFYAEIDSGGLFSDDTTHINAERYTSKGGLGANGLPYYFGPTGQPLTGAPVLVNKPDFTSCDGGNTSVFGFDYSFNLGGVIYDTDSYPNFFGTSAAAPNAAAIAALLLERAPQTTPAQLNRVMQATAHDIVSDIPLSGVGPDDITGAGWIDAAAAVGAVPGILLQPVDLTANPNGSVVFSVIATGAPVLNFQWSRNGLDVGGENASTLTVTATSALSGALYRCRVSNDYGTVASRDARLNVNPPPFITLQPQDQNINQGAAVQFAVLAVNGTLSYQWQRNGQPILGAIFSSYNLVSVTPDDDGATFNCVVTNAAGSTPSLSATLTVNPIPRITQQPRSLIALQGRPATFSVLAENGTLSYQWLRNGAEIPGATASSYTLANTAPADAGALFDCLVSNNAGSTLSGTAVLNVLQLPLILQQPANAFVAPGVSVSFSVQALNGTLSYQWRRNGVDIAGAVSNTLTVTQTTFADSGTLFSCLVSNEAGSVLSASALLTVDSAPLLSSAPTALPPVAVIGQSVQFTLAAQATFNQVLTYSWNFGDGSPLYTSTTAGATHTFSAAGIYSVSVTAVDALGLSAAAALKEVVFEQLLASGVPSVLPAADNSFFPDAVLQAENLAALPLDVRALKIKLNFAHQNSDALTLSGTLPLTSETGLNGQVLQIVIGGIGRAFTLGATGLSFKDAAHGTTFRFSTTKGAVPQARFALVLQKSVLQSFLAGSGLTNANARKQARNVRVSVLFEGRLYDAVRTVTYSASAGKSGSAR